MTKNNLPVLQLSAEHMSPEEQFLAWRTSVKPLFDVQLRSHRDIDQFAASSTWYLLDNIMLGSANFSASRYQRNSKWIAQHADSDDIAFMLSFEGGCLGVNGGREYIDVTGTITAVDIAKEFYSQSDGCKGMFVVIPRHLIKNANKLNGRTLPANSVKARVLRDHILAQWRVLPDITSEESPAFSQGLIDLINAMFTPDDILSQEETVAFDNSLFASVKYYIEENLASTQLGADLLCRRFHCSRATLYRLFQPCGGVAHYIKERRLVATFKALVKPSTANRRIIDVAMQFGFNNQSTFSHMFHRYFGVAPSEVAALKITPPLSNGQPASQILTAQRIAQWLKTL